MTSTAFNLIRAPWLPVRRRSGAVERIAPWQVNDGIDENPFVAFAWPRPDFDGAAHEFLIGLLSSAAAPADDEEWEGWWSCPPAPQLLRERFARVAHAFDLDGPGPCFLQDLDPLESTEDKNVAVLLIDAPGAQTLRNNADLFVKRDTAPVLCRAAAAMALYTLNAYAPTGGAGHRTSLRGGGPMTTLTVAEHEEHGDTLWGRLWPNVETTEQIERRSTQVTISDDPKSIFPWLVPTRASNPKDGGRRTAPGDVHSLQVYWGMPRRIRLSFEGAEGRACGLTGIEDPVVVANYRTKNYGTDYTDGFEHPLTPYYRQKAGAAKLPVHPRPGGVTYRLWPGLVVRSEDGLREPAQTVRHIHARKPSWLEARVAAFGYDMDNMKARAWIQSEMPLWLLDDGATREWLERFVEQATAGAATVASLLTRAVKAALYARPSDAAGDYGFVAERFYRDTEDSFFHALKDVAEAARRYPDADDPTMQARENWAPAMAAAAHRLFDEYAPADGLEDRNMHRHVKARFFLMLALSGRGKAGRSLFERDLGIASPETARKRKEAA